MKEHKANKSEERRDTDKYVREQFHRLFDVVEVESEGKNFSRRERERLPVFVFTQQR